VTWWDHDDAPFPLDGEDPGQRAWWEGLNRAERERWGPLLGRLDRPGRMRFHVARRSMRERFRQAEGTPSRRVEENAAEELLYRRVAEAVGKLDSRECAAGGTP
jgi:hypothetical protein